ncbi:MAG: hypothetical protein R3F20_02585 [Planctomycetota bacterium]
MKFESFLLAAALAAAGPLAGQNVLLEVQGSPTAAAVVACAGDVDGDGIPDLAIGDSYAGLLEIRAGVDGSIIRTITLPPILDAFGNLPSYAVETLGDVDQDGVDDLLVGRVGDALVGIVGFVPQGPGSARVLSGADGSVIHTVAPANGEQSFGFAAIALGDVDGDGVRDFAVGCPRADVGSAIEAGYVRVHSGANGAPIHTHYGSASGARFGQSLALAGDRDGDGIADLVVASNAGGGRAEIFSGGTGAPLAILAAGSTSTAGGFGLGHPDTEVAAGGDFDGDGVTDVALGKRGDSTGGYNAGAIFVFSGANDVVLHASYGAPCDGIGARLELVDVTGDGKADLVAAQRNDLGHTDDVTVISGETGSAAFDTGAISSDLTQIALAGDIDGDGTVDLVGGTDPFGANPGYAAVIASGPVVGAAGQGEVLDVLGDREDVLFVNGESGHGARRLDVPRTSPLTFEVRQPSLAAVPATFAIFGRLGAPDEVEAVALPFGLGTVAVHPAPLFPQAAGLLFTLASSAGPMPGGELLPATPAPWAYVVPPLGFEATFTLQGLVATAPGSFEPTNAVIVRLR